MSKKIDEKDKKTILRVYNRIKKCNLQIINTQNRRTMKTIKSLSFICVFWLILISVNAQEQAAQEPDFPGEVLSINQNGNMLLEKSLVQLKKSVDITGIGSPKTIMIVDGCCARTHLKGSSNTQFIVKVADNNVNPSSVIKIVQFENKKKERIAELSENGTFDETSGNKLTLLPFTAKKYGNSSFILTVNTNLSGEFGVAVLNPRALNEKLNIISCFGVK